MIEYRMTLSDSSRFQSTKKKGESMGNQNLTLIDHILTRKGYAVSFQQRIHGAVVCTATKDDDKREVLARSVAEGLAELARLLGLSNLNWNMSAPREYGFYANVNPDVDHPRWSQARERRIGTGLFANKIPTRPFNGYAEQVADLYKGLDLRKNY